MSRFQVVAKIDRIFGLNVIFLILSGAPIHEIYQTRPTFYG